MEIEFCSSLLRERECPSLYDIDKHKCQGLLTEKESLEALKTMDTSKSTGPDGRPAEFYTLFCKDVSPFVIHGLNKSCQRGKLTVTPRLKRHHFIDPQKGKAPQELKNWRPITLLNCNYKIGSKEGIVSRLKVVLQHLGDNDQTSFLKGCSTAENSCLINNVISYPESKNNYSQVTSLC